MLPYSVKIGDKVTHIKDDCVGVILELDDNLSGHTTCQVLWDDSDTPDVQWTNKLVKIKE